MIKPYFFVIIEFMISEFENLMVWQKSHEQSLRIYNLTKEFPKEELFCVTNQIRRSAISIENNIAEGFGRRTKKDFANFIHISLGSLYETRCLLRICKDLNYISLKIYHQVNEEYKTISYMLKKLITKLKN